MAAKDNPFGNVGNPRKRGRTPGTITKDVKLALDKLRKAAATGKVVVVTPLQGTAVPPGNLKGATLVRIAKSQDTINGYVARLMKEGAITHKESIEGGIRIINVKVKAGS